MDGWLSRPHTPPATGRYTVASAWPAAAPLLAGMASRHQPITENSMKISATLAMLLAGSIAVPALAQTPATEVQRNTNQQQRIEQGLQSGSLNTKEAGQLERQQTHVDKMEKNALKDRT